MGEKPTAAEEGEAARKAAEQKGKDHADERTSGVEWPETPEVSVAHEGGGATPPNEPGNLAVSDEGAPGTKPKSTK